METPFDLPYRVAAKTGTARGFMDTWAIAATNELLVGAWAGSIDGAPTQGIVGMDAAGPLAREALLVVAGGAKLTLPKRPPDVVEIEVCATSGLLPSAACPRIRDYAHRDAPPVAIDSWHDATGAISYPARANGWLRRRGG
jgi:penicillin-binding protein 1C